MRANGISLIIYAMAILALTVDNTAEAFVRGVTTTRACPASPSELNAVAKKKKKKKAKTAAKAAAKKKAPVDTLKKADFVAAVAEELGSTKAGADAAVAAVLNTIADNVVQGKKVTLQGFGSFQLRARAARKGRNPQTGETIDIKASNSVGFTAAKALKDLANE